MDKITYYLYHIPGKKIGVTRNIIDRVTKQQGYQPGEYEVLDQSTDIDYISKREIELQQSYGYKVDKKLYKNLFNTMKINATETTSTFPYPLNKLKGNLMDHLGKTWKTMYGDFELTKETVKWIIDNAKTSMYDASRTYIYNKAYYEEFINFFEKHVDKVNIRNQEFLEALKTRLVSNGNEVYTDLEPPITDTTSSFDKIREWAGKRGLYRKGDTKTQFCKLMEEAGELGRAVLKNDKEEFVDAIGDMVVVLTNLAHLGGYTIEECIESAYEVISKRTGRMENGTFVKDGK